VYELVYVCVLDLFLCRRLCLLLSCRQKLHRPPLGVHDISSGCLCEHADDQDSKRGPAQSRWCDSQGVAAVAASRLARSIFVGCAQAGTAAASCCWRLSNPVSSGQLGQDAGLLIQTWCVLYVCVCVCVLTTEILVACLL
jgi:hypothetical protein